MNKILGILVIAVLAGCTSDKLADELPGEDSEVGTAVTFDTYTGRAKSRAVGSPTRASTQYFVDGVVNTTIPRQTQVGIFAWSQKTTDADGKETWTSWSPTNSFYADFMYNQPAQAQTVQRGKAELSYSPTRFWPKDTNKKFAFFAYYPYVKDLKMTENGITLGTDTEGKGINKFHFKVQSDPKDQVDFLVSDYVVNYNGTGKGAVALNFRHALAQVAVNVQLSREMQHNGARIDESSLKVKLTGAYGEGDLTVTPGTDGKVTLGWATTGEQLTFETSPSSLSSATDSRSAVLLMIPQPIAPITLSVEYNINFYEVDEDGNLVVDNNGNYHKLYSYENNTASVSLANARDWEAGQKFIYNVNVNLQGITVTPEVVDWVDNFDNTDH